MFGAHPVTILSGSHWFVNFIDNCTRMIWVCLMKSNNEVNLLFQFFLKMVCRHQYWTSQVLRNDNEGEYLSSELQQYLEAHRTIHQTTCSNTPP